MTYDRTSAMAMGEIWAAGVSGRRWCCTPEGFEMAAGALSDRVRWPGTWGAGIGIRESGNQTCTSPVRAECAASSVMRAMRDVSRQKARRDHSPDVDCHPELREGSLQSSVRKNDSVSTSGPDSDPHVARSPRASEIPQSLGSFGMTSAEARPYLTTRLLARQHQPAPRLSNTAGPVFRAPVPYEGHTWFWSCTDRARSVAR